MAGDSVTVQFEGYKELMAALKLIYPELYKETRVALRGIVDMVAKDAVQWADRQGFTPPGRSGRGVGNLIGEIRTGVTMTKGYIRDLATDASQGRGNNTGEGYSYPRRYEYERGGERAFIHPAIKQDEGKILAGLVAVIDRVSTRFNEGGL